MSIKITAVFLLSVFDIVDKKKTVERRLERRIANEMAFSVQRITLKANVSTGFSWTASKISEATLCRIKHWEILSKVY